MTAEFNLGDKAFMMYDNKPVRVIVIERKFIRKEYFSRFNSVKETTGEYVEYKVITRHGIEIKAGSHQLFHTLEELTERLEKDCF